MSLANDFLGEVKNRFVGKHVRDASRNVGVLERCFMEGDVLCFDITYNCGELKLVRPSMTVYTDRLRYGTVTETVRGHLFGSYDLVEEPAPSSERQ